MDRGSHWNHYPLNDFPESVQARTWINNSMRVINAEAGNSVPESLSKSVEQSAEAAPGIMHGLGKRALVFAAATVAIGAVMVVASKLFHKSPAAPDKNWVDQTRQENLPARSL